MLYTMVIEKGNDKEAHGLYFPDFGDLVSACDEWNDITYTANECIDFYLESLVEDGMEIPLPQNIEKYINNPKYKNFIFMTIDIDLEKYSNKSEKLSISLPKRIVTSIDNEVARKPQYKSRSGFLAEASLRLLNRI